MHELSLPDETWRRIAPELDEGLERLGKPERNAILLRFFEEKNHHEVGTTLGITEEAAKKRVNRALEKLRGLPMAVLTNKPVNISERILEGLGLAGFFRAIYGGNSFATKKPDPLGANKILSELEIPPAQAAMVGDSEVDVQTARNAGMISAIVNFGFGAHDREMHPADIYLDRMEELVPLIAIGSN